MRKHHLTLFATVLTGCLTVTAEPRNGVLQEIWLRVPGETVADLTSNPAFGGAPSRTRIVERFDHNALDDNYGSRSSALVVPPQTGEYTFWLACDDGGELWLSTDETAGTRQLIAAVTGYTDKDQWDRQKGQKSEAIKLTAGSRYLLVALQKEGGGGDHMSVAWQGSGIKRQIIDTQHLQLPALDAETLVAVKATKAADRELDEAKERAAEYWTAGKTLPVEFSARFPFTGAPPRNDTGINVLVDQAHQTQFATLWGLKGQIGGQGFRACSSIACLDSVLKPGGNSRVRIRIGDMEPFAWYPNPEFNVILTSQQDFNAQIYTPEECRALKSFVEAGGGLLVLGNRPRSQEEADTWSMNTMLGQFGARFTHDAEKADGGTCAALALGDEWEALLTGEGKRPVRARRTFGKGRVLICESRNVIAPGKGEAKDVSQKKLNVLKEHLLWLAAGKAPVGGPGQMPSLGGVGIFPELDQNMKSVVVYYAANQSPEVMTCIREHIPRAAKQIRDWLPSKVFDEPYNIVICAGGGGGWAINGRPKAAAVISYDSLGILGIFAHEMAHTMGGPRNANDELAGQSPHQNQGEAHAGWFQGKIGALFSGKTDDANRGCNRILDLEKKKGRQLDLAKEHQTPAGREFWGKGPEWTKLWYVWQKLDDRYGPTWYPRWYWVRATRWADEPGHQETWDEMVEDMSIAVGEDLFPFFRKVGTTLTKDRLARIEFQGKVMELAVAPLDTSPAGNVCLNPIGDYTKALTY